MLKQIITILLNYLMSYVFIPVSMVVIDYFKMKNVVKKQREEIEALKKASTLKEKEDASDNIN